MRKEKKYTFKEVYPLSKSKVWELLSNTDHLNRVIGLFAVQFSPAQFDDASFYREANAKALGLVPIKWREYPFEWVKEERYAVERKYLSGPLKGFYGGVYLTKKEPLPDGTPQTEVILFATFTSAGILGNIAIPLVGLSSMKNTMKYLNTYLTKNANREVELLPQVKSTYTVEA